MLPAERARFFPGARAQLLFGGRRLTIRRRRSRKSFRMGHEAIILNMGILWFKRFERFEGFEGFKGFW
jgi:hypothetical protein